MSKLELSEFDFAGSCGKEVRLALCIAGLEWFSSGNLDHVSAEEFAHCPKLQGIELAVREPKVVAWCGQS